MAGGRGDYQSRETKKPKKDKQKAQSGTAFGPPPEPQVIPKGKAAKPREDV